MISFSKFITFRHRYFSSFKGETVSGQKELEHLKKSTLTITVVTFLGSSYMLAAVNVALPVIGKKLEMSSVMLGWVTISSLLSSGILMVPVGRAADIYGRKKIFICGLVILLIGTVFCGLAPSGLFLIFMRVIQGIGAAMIWGTMVAIISSVFSSEERGRALGISVAANYAGLAVGPFLGGLLTQYLGWRSIFFLYAITMATAIVLSLKNLTGEWIEAAGERFDLTGSLLLAVSLGLLIYSFTKLPSTLSFLLLTIGFIGMVAFVRYEKNSESPVLNVCVLGKNKVFIFSNLATMINYGATFALNFLLSLYLQYVQGFSPQGAGVLLVINPLAMAFFSPLSGRLSDRFQPQIIAAIGMGLSSMSMALFSLLNETSGVIIISVLMFLTGLASAVFSTPNANAVMGCVEKKYLGVAAGTQATTRTVGMVLSIGIIMILFNIIMGGRQITTEYYIEFLKSMKTGFAIFAILSFVGIFSQLAGRKEQLYKE